MKFVFDRIETIEGKDEHAWGMQSDLGFTDSSMEIFYPSNNVETALLVFYKLQSS